MAFESRETVARQLRVVWIGFLGGVGVYTALLFGLLQQQPSPRVEPTLLAVLRPTFITASFLIALGSIVWHRNLSEQFASTVDPNPPLAAKPQGSSPVDRVRMGCVVTWALSEAIALFGFVLGFLSGSLAFYAPFAAAAAILLYVHRLETWPLAEAVQRARQSP
jgi:hypothetical protein